MVNYFLQGDPYQGMVHFTRFFLNSLLGMGGLYRCGRDGEPAAAAWSSRTASAARLGHYGVGYGPYVQLPFYGSFTVRDDGGDMADGVVSGAARG